MKVKYRKVLLMLLSVFSLFSCMRSDIPLPPYGRITIHCSIAHEEKTKVIDTNDIVKSRIYLKQEDRIVIDEGISIDNTTKSASHLLVNIENGSYTATVLLWYADGKIHYISKAVINVTYGENGVFEMPLFDDYLATLHYWSEWDENTPRMNSVVVELTGCENFSHEYKNADQSPPAIDDLIDSLYPDLYMIEVFYNGLVLPVPTNKSTAIQNLQIRYPDNEVIIKGLRLKVCLPNVYIMGNDQVPPRITEGPFVTYFANENGSGIKAYVSWTTDIEATSNVCCSRTQNFDYRNNLFWAPAVYDSQASTKTHKVEIPTFTNNPNDLIYFVVVTSDEEGDMNISAEIKIPPLTKACADAIIGGRPDIPIQYKKDGWVNVGSSNNLNIVLNWSNVDPGGFRDEWLKYGCCHGN